MRRVILETYRVGEIPITTMSADLYRMLKPLYAAHPEHLRLNIYDDAGHRVTTAMMEDACIWFRRYL